MFGIASWTITLVPRSLNSHVKEDHRLTSFALPAEEGIWVGRSTETPGADIIVPITWDGGAGCYILGKSKAVFGCKVDNGHFPLRSGPDALRLDSLDEFEGFIQSFEYQMYGNEITEEDKAWQIEGEDPLAEVEAIELKRGKGKKAKYLVKWVGSDKKTWEPLSHLKAPGLRMPLHSMRLSSGGNQLRIRRRERPSRMCLCLTPTLTLNLTLILN